MSDQHLLLVVGEKQQLRQSANHFRLENLKTTCVENSVCIQQFESLADILSSPEQAMQLLAFIQPTIIVCGELGKAEIVKVCQHLRTQGHNVIVLLDCLEIRDGLPSSVNEVLELELCQLSLTEAVVYLLNSQTQFVYAYPKADIAASIVVLFEHSARVLLIKRKYEPFKDALALPGGFLRPLLEDLPTCAARELFEETGLRLQPSDFRLVSVRSNPNRDRRGHVIDHGYCALIKRSREEALLKTLLAKDDAADVLLAPVNVAMRTSLAADHSSLLSDAMQMMRRKLVPSPLAMIKQWTSWSWSRA
ncbi:MAG: NUDIX hydrolase [Candidatus Obscuribacterales bacterium]|nr:NUDIX hydrolase [Candidatus Obscuribacterales bacterium]